MKALDLIARKYKYPLIVTTHPRTKKRLDELTIAPNNLIHFHKPFGIFDFVKLQKNAYCVLSDSGTINEDAGIMGIPALVIDAIRGGAKITKQAQTIRWPNVINIDHLSEQSLADGFRYCFTDEARKKTLECKELAIEKLKRHEKILNDFIKGSLWHE